MASFTDNIPTFNSYVQQLPVEAMVSVGQAKQQQYNEGIQKIQTNIDNVAGMDIVRDVDKEYLQSKLNQLGNDTRLFAAADFSDAPRHAARRCLHRAGSSGQAGSWGVSL